jgi:hypothetical protein
MSASLVWSGFSSVRQHVYLGVDDLRLSALILFRRYLADTHRGFPFYQRVALELYFSN